ncbi:ABC transporter permease [Nocardioides limicola]|uniref:ABC transporter permease n=1 Tax=Nocardioides limicola TaxID=2803368 RepID=UPI00193C6A84|nr:ABC transporter permease [Nocardioides sp. DJM-14]
MNSDTRRRSTQLCLAIPAAFLLVAPTLVVVPMSFTASPLLSFPPTGFSTQWYGRLASDEAWRLATLTSLSVAIQATLLATSVGTLTAFGIARGRFPGKSLVQALVLSPAIVPIVLVAIGTFFAYGRVGLVGTPAGLVLAHGALAVPLVVVTVAASIETMDPRLDLAAASLGAGPFRTFFLVTLPLIRPGVLAGALLAFVTSWDELVVSLFLTTPVLRTLPVEMWTSVREQLDPTVAAASTMLVALSTAGLVIAYVIGLRQARRKS